MKKIDEMAFFRKPSGKIAFNDVCKHCANQCKQSYKVEILRCPLYENKDRKET